MLSQFEDHRSNFARLEIYFLYTVFSFVQFNSISFLPENWFSLLLRFIHRFVFSESETEIVHSRGNPEKIVSSTDAAAAHHHFDLDDNTKNEIRESVVSSKTKNIYSIISSYSNKYNEINKS